MARQRRCFVPLWDQNESIDDLDEAMVLGYFESIKGVYITKWVMLWNLTTADHERFDQAKLQPVVTHAVQALYPFEQCYNALANPANEHLVANIVDDVITTGVISAWCVFEQLIKNLPIPNYAHHPEQLNASYQRNAFGLNKAEKDNLDLFYYVRNAIVHYNGAYFATTAINHTYNGQNFASVGHEGEKIDVSETTAWRMICDIEQYSIKAWANWSAWRAAHP
jgi:hypothetical protein